MRLANSSLADLPGDVPGPTYDRSSVVPGIMHFGVGGFHRAHQAMYVDRLLSAGGARDWGICGVGTLESDERMNRVMQDQDGLYTLVLKHPDGTLEPRVIGSIVEYLYAPGDPAAVVERLADPKIRIASLTVTEGGYNIDQITGEFQSDAPAILADLEPGALPRTVFGMITAGLELRRRRGIEPFTVMSCDNIPGNGDVARRAFSTFARLRDPELADWIVESVHFPNSMVDRITPVTTDEDRALVRERWGIDDEWPVVAEPFAQWVLEDSFGLGRPAYDEAGVQVVDDVMPYELMKLRLLNVGHQGIAYFGVLAGYTYAHDAARDPRLIALLEHYWADEARPTLGPVPGVDLDAYTAELLERFGNEHIRDTLARLAAESSDRIPNWLVPVIVQHIDDGGAVPASAAIVASWARYDEGVLDDGRSIEIVDRLATSRHAAALAQREDPLAFVRDASLFGDLAERPEFVAPYTEALDALHNGGVDAALRRFVSPE